MEGLAPLSECLHGQCYNVIDFMFAKLRIAKQIHKYKYVSAICSFDKNESSPLSSQREDNM